jgi:uncharacterized protein
VGGLAAFALTTTLLSVVNAGWLPDTVEPVVFGLVLAYGGIGQFAGVTAFTWRRQIVPVGPRE